MLCKLDEPHLTYIAVNLGLPLLRSHRLWYYERYTRGKRTLKSELMLLDENGLEY